MAEPQAAEKYEEVFDEDGPPPKEAASIHRIRANSTIMQLKKILGEFLREGRGFLGRIVASFDAQLPLNDC